MHGRQAGSDEQAETQQATTTSFDVIQTQAILRQLTGNSGGAYRIERKSVYQRCLQLVRSWFSKDR